MYCEDIYHAIFSNNLEKKKNNSPGQSEINFKDMVDFKREMDYNLNKALKCQGDTKVF